MTITAIFPGVNKLEHSGPPPLFVQGLIFWGIMALLLTNFVALVVVPFRWVGRRIFPAHTHTS